MVVPKVFTCRARNYEEWSNGDSTVVKICWFCLETMNIPNRFYPCMHTTTKERFQQVSSRRQCEHHLWAIWNSFRIGTGFRLLSRTFQQFSQQQISWRLFFSRVTTLQRSNAVWSVTASTLLCLVTWTVVRSRSKELYKKLSKKKLKKNIYMEGILNE